MKPLSLFLFLMSSLSGPGQNMHYKPVLSDGKGVHFTQHFTRDYIVVRHSDTVEVNFLLPPLAAMPFGDSVWLQEKIVITCGDSPLELSPQQVESFCYRGTNYEALSSADETQTTPRTSERKFCKRLLTGAITVLSCNEIITDEAGNRSVISNLYYKQDAQYKPASLFNFNRGLSKRISPPRDLSEDAIGKKFDRNEFLAIVGEYNRYLEPKTSH